MAILYLLLGLGGLLVGSDLAVRGSLSIAYRFGWPSWLTGLILLAMGTSLPELFVSTASAPAHPALAFGNLFGSNAFNVGLVLGLSLAIKGKASLELKSVGLPSLFPLLLGSILIFLLPAQVAPKATIGVCLLGAFALLLLMSFRGRGPLAPEDDAAPSTHWPLLWAVHATLIGFVLLAMAASWFLRGALDVAAQLGWAEGFAGFLITAAGTSAPEQFTSWRALRLGHAGAIFGNVVGSNAFNLLLVGGAVCLLADPEATYRSLDRQMWINLIATLVLFLPAVLLEFLPRGARRYQMGAGLALMAAYLVGAWWVFRA